MKAQYEAILYHEHRISSKRQPMSLHDRAAQFAPFAALNGHEEEIEEAARQVKSQETLSEDAMEKLNQALQFLCTHPYSGLQVHLRYFQPDAKKSGGAYLAYTGTFKYFREDTKMLVFADGTEIGVERVAEILF